MAKKGKRNLIIEVMGEQMNLIEFKKILDKQLKANGVKYSEDVNMYFNVAESKVYCVSDEGKNVEIGFNK